MSNDLPTFRKVIFKVNAFQEVLATGIGNHENKRGKIVLEVGIFPVRPACNVESPAELLELNETAYRKTLCFQHLSAAPSSGGEAKSFSPITTLCCHSSGKLVRFRESRRKTTALQLSLGAPLSSLHSGTLA